VTIYARSVLFMRNSIYWQQNWSYTSYFLHFHQLLLYNKWRRD